MNPRLCVLLALAALMPATMAALPADAQRTGSALGLQRYQLMMTALQRAGSVHVTIVTSKPRVIIAGDSMWRRVAGWMDISLSQDRMRASVVDEVLPLRGRRNGFSRRTEVIGSGARLAQRNSGAPWMCQTLEPAELAPTYQLTAYFPLPAHPRTVRSLGIGSFHGAATWRLGLTIAQTTITLSVSQRTHRLVRESLRLIKGYGVATPPVIVAYSRYGEPLTVQLPQVCR